MSATATSAGTFKMGGEIEVTRLGYGAMRITGEGIWGPPKDHDAAITVRRQLSPRRRRTRSPARSTPAPLARRRHARTLSHQHAAEAVIDSSVERNAHRSALSARA